VGSFALTHGTASLIACSLFWSLGFHCWAPLREALALNLSDAAKGARLGQLRSVDGVGSLLGLGTFFLLLPGLGFRWLFVLAGLVAMAGGMVSFPMAPVEAPIDQPRWVWKRKYLLYYLLAFLSSYRRFFWTFSRYALVREFGVDAKSISVLMMVNTALSLFVCPLIGRTVDRIGDRRSLTLTFAGLVVVLAGYALSGYANTPPRVALANPLESKAVVPVVEATGDAGTDDALDSPARRFSPWVWFLFALFVLDNLVAPFSLASSTYLNKIAESGDLRPTLSMWVTMDHIVAVVMPLISGSLWDRVGYQWVFAGCTLIALAAMGVTQLVPDDAKRKGKEGIKGERGD
jgi:predicted MFS family arabinose efflux permease